MHICIAVSAALVRTIMKVSGKGFETVSAARHRVCGHTHGPHSMLLISRSPHLSADRINKLSQQVCEHGRRKGGARGDGGVVCMEGVGRGCEVCN